MQCDKICITVSQMQVSYDVTECSRESSVVVVCCHAQGGHGYVRCIEDSPCGHIPDSLLR